MIFSFLKIKKSLIFPERKLKPHLPSTKPKKVSAGLSEPRLEPMVGVSFVFHVLGIAILIFTLQKLSFNPPLKLPLQSTWVNLITLNEFSTEERTNRVNSSLPSNPEPKKNEERKKSITPPKNLRKNNSPLIDSSKLNSNPKEKIFKSTAKEENEQVYSNNYGNENNVTGMKTALLFPNNPDGPSGNGSGGDGKLEGEGNSAAFLPENYLNTVRFLIEQHKTYPRRASNRQIEGTVIIQFRITPEGIAEGIGIIKSSGYEILDKAGIKAVHNASPFPPPPSSFSSISIEIPIIFKLVN